MRQKGQQRGSALVLVLSSLVLMALLVLGYMTTARVEKSAARFYALTTDLANLQDSAVAFIISHIAQATEDALDVYPHTKAWTSQPGLIRTFDIDGNPVEGFKLYSSTNMFYSTDDHFKKLIDNPDSWTDTDATNALLAEVPLDWRSRSAEFVDINASATVVRNGQTNIVYPIVDPRAAATNSIVTIPVEGFAITTNSSTAWTGGPLAFQSSLNQAPKDLPMPVRWMYVLRDGTLRAVSPGGELLGTAATSNNPIVGRMAFWTDDETSKVNVNTASEGMFWCDPIGNTYDQRGAMVGNNQQLIIKKFGYGLAMPHLDEWQRTPGHPAMACLSAVLGGIMPAPRPAIIPDPGNNQEPPVSVNALNYYTNYYALAPRVYQGGTWGGTYPTGVQTNSLFAEYRMYYKRDRLYASVSEYFGALLKQETNNPAAVVTNLAARDFFLTAHSRAAEINLFGQPRMCLWPVAKDTNATSRNPMASLIAFCSTIGKSNPVSYYFMRYANGDAGGSHLSFTNDIGLSNNTRFFAYLTNFTGKQVPGFGGGANGYIDKYGAGAIGTDERDQIIVAMLDFIRTSQLSKGGTTENPWGGSSAMAAPMIYKTPTTVIRGMGRYPLVVEMSLIFYASEIKDRTSFGTNTRVDTGGSPDVEDWKPPFEPTLTPDGLPDDEGLFTVGMSNPAYNGYRCFWSTNDEYTNTFYIKAGGAIDTNAVPGTIPDWKGGPLTVQGFRVRYPYSLDPVTDTNPHNMPVYDQVGNPMTTRYNVYALVQPYLPMVGLPGEWYTGQVMIDIHEKTGGSGLRGGTSGTETFNWPARAYNVLKGSAYLHPFSVFFGTINKPNWTDAMEARQFTGSEETTAFTDPNSTGRKIFPWFGVNVPQTVNIVPLYLGGTNSYTSYGVNYTEYNLQMNSKAIYTGNIFRPWDTANSINTFRLADADLVADVYMRDEASSGKLPGQLISSYNFHFPAVRLQVPTYEPLLAYRVNFNEDYGIRRYTNAGHWSMRSVLNHEGAKGIDTMMCTPPLSSISNSVLPNQWTNFLGAIIHETPDPKRDNAFYSGGPFFPLSLNERLKVDSYTGSSTPSGYSWLATEGWWSGSRLKTRRGDIIRSVGWVGTNSNGGAYDFRGDVRLLAFMSNVPSEYFGPIGDYFNVKQRQFSTLRHGQAYKGGGETDLISSICYAWDPVTDDGLVRYYGTAFGPTPFSLEPSQGVDVMNIHSNVVSKWGNKYASFGTLISSNVVAGIGGKAPVPWGLNGALMSNAWTTNHLAPGDFVTGMGSSPHGSLFVRLGEIRTPSAIGAYGGGEEWFGGNPASGGGSGANQSTFSPNRELPSAIYHFGSIPSGASRKLPWQSLLFCANPAAGTNHPGFGTDTHSVRGPRAIPPYTELPDFLWLDLFWMPIVQPYAISEPFSTGGKINMNYQIAPFSYIHRDTAVRAAMKAVNVIAIPTRSELSRMTAPEPYIDSVDPSYASFLKSYNGTLTDGATGVPSSIDYQINLSETLKGFEERFATGNVFRSASEICSLFIVPEQMNGRTYTSSNAPIFPTYAGAPLYPHQAITNVPYPPKRTITGPYYTNPPSERIWYSTNSAMEAGYTINSTNSTAEDWWNSNRYLLTGKNVRELPYAHIYPRLTVNSNVYKIHFIVQTIQKAKDNSSQNKFDPLVDKITGNYRGSVIVERYLDPNLEPYQASDKYAFWNPDTMPVPPYKWRIVEARQFAP